MSAKKIEVDKHSIICGSIRIALQGRKKGLWYRFSRQDEKGDLFDLIKVKNEDYRVMFYSVLGNTLVAPDIEIATEVAYGN